MSNLGISLWITLIGILLIFAAILILWGVMELLVKLTASKKKAVVTEPQEEPVQLEAPATTALSDNKRKAAVAAVAAALAMQRTGASLSAAPESAELSAWQVAPMQK